MSYRRAVWLPDVLRKAGLKIVEIDGWSRRGLEGGDFEPRAVVYHHDASARGDSPGVVAFMLRNFANGAAQCWVDRYGVWHVLAAGRCAHAGVTLPGMPTNSTSIGVETDHTVGEHWPADQLDSLRRGTAAILRHLEQGPGGLHFHKTICSPPGRKVDPAGLTLASERAVIADLLKPPLPEVSLRWMLDAYESGKRSRKPLHTAQVRRVQKALGMRVRSGLWRSGTRRRFQARFGHTKPTTADLVALGKGKFRVTG